MIILNNLFILRASVEENIFLRAFFDKIIHSKQNLLQEEIIRLTLKKNVLVKMDFLMKSVVSVFL